MNRSRVLLIDHDPDFLDSLSKALSRGGTLPFEVAVSSTGAEGLPLSTPDCDALVCTIERPEEIDVLARLKKSDGRLPIIALLQTHDPGLADRARAAGADSILTRNRLPDEVASPLRTALEHCLLARQSADLAAEARSKSQELRALIGENRRIVRAFRAGSPKASELHPALVVDDDDAAASSLQSILERSDFRCPHVARSADEAMAYLTGGAPFEDRRRFPLPYLMFLHLHLQEKSGFELLRWMRGRADFRQTVVIAHSAATDPDDVRRAYECGANSVVARPGTESGWRELVTAVRIFWVRMNV